MSDSSDNDPGLYVGRLLLNSKQLRDWVGSQDHPVLSSHELDEDLHVTVIYSPVFIAPLSDGEEHVVVEPVSWGVLGKDDALVLYINAPELYTRWSEYLSNGAVSTHGEYRPHLTLFYLGADSGLTDEDVADLPLPDFELEFGMEIFGTLDQDVFDGITL